MSYFEFPQTRNYEGDLGYIIKKLMELTTNYNTFFEYNSIRFHDPITWNITIDYPAWNIVYSQSTGYMMIAIKPVPAGIDISNEDYWKKIIPFSIETEFDIESFNPIANKTVTNKFNLVDADIELLNQKLTQEINDRLIEVEERKAADIALDDKIEAETAARIANVETLTESISETNDNLSTEARARQSADTTINARIDNIIALTPGSTTGDAELADIRIAADGSTYDTAGDAVRGQINTVMADFSPAFVAQMLLDKSAIKVSAIKNVRKEIAAASTWQTDTYAVYTNISCVEGQTVLIHVNSRSIDGSGTNSYGVYTFKDINGNAVGSNRQIRWNTTGVNTTTGECNIIDSVPANAVTVDVTIYGISNAAPTIGNICHLDGVCIIIGDVIDSDVKGLMKKSTLGYNFIRGGYFGGVLDKAVKYRISSDMVYTAAMSFALSIADGFRYGVGRYDSQGNFLGDTGWITSNHQVNAGENFVITISKISEDSSAYTADIQEFINAITFFPIVNTDSVSPYYYYGNVIETKRHNINVTNFGVTRVAPSDESKVMQGGTIFNGKLFQGYKDNYIQIYDIATNNLDAQFNINGGHCNSMEFSKEYYNSSDDYPLLYITDMSGIVHVNRIQSNSATLIRTLSFPQEQTGYYAGHTLDRDRNRIYMIGYTQSSYRDPANNNHMIISEWDLNTLYDNVDETKTPKFVKSFTLPFIYCVQDMAFFNNKIFAISSFLYTEEVSKLVVINPMAETIANTITALPSTITDTEDEFIAFDIESDIYYLIVGNHTKYYKIAFN